MLFDLLAWTVDNPPGRTPDCQSLEVPPFIHKADMFRFLLSYMSDDEPRDYCALVFVQQSNRLSLLCHMVYDE